MRGLHWYKIYLAKDVVKFTLLVLFLQHLATVFYLVSAFSVFHWQPHFCEGKISDCRIFHNPCHKNGVRLHSRTWLALDSSQMFVKSFVIDVNLRRKNKNLEISGFLAE